MLCPDSSFIAHHSSRTVTQSSKETYFFFFHMPLLWRGCRIDISPYIYISDMVLIFCDVMGGHGFKLIAEGKLD